MKQLLLYLPVIHSGYEGFLARHADAAEISELEELYCGRVAVLERMATVSTSARLRRIQLGLPEPWDPPAGQPGGPADGMADGGEPGRSPASP